MGVNEFAGIQQHQNKYDIVLVLGSINFGDKKEIDRQVSNVVKFKEYWRKDILRCNWFSTHDNDHTNGLI